MCLSDLADSVGVLAGILGADAAMRIATACGIATMLRAFGASAPTSGGLVEVVVDGAGCSG